MKLDNIGYTVVEDDSATGYLLEKKGEHIDHDNLQQVAKRTLTTLLRGDLYSLVSFLEHTDHAKSLEFYWDAIPRCNRGARLDYLNQSRALLLAFAGNSHTSTRIIEEVLTEPSPYGDLYMGVEPDIARKFVDHPSCTDEIADKHKERTERFGGYTQQDFEDLIASESKATAAFMEDKDLLERMRNVREEDRGGLERVMRFNPRDVEKLGLDYVRRNFVRLFGATYNKTTGEFVGYID